MMEAISIYENNFIQNGSQSFSIFQRNLLQSGLVVLDLNEKNKNPHLAKAILLCECLQFIHQNKKFQLSELKKEYNYLDFKIVVISNRKKMYTLVDGNQSKLFFICKLQSSVNDLVIV